MTPYAAEGVDQVGKRACTWLGSEQDVLANCMLRTCGGRAFVVATIGCSHDRTCIFVGSFVSAVRAAGGMNDVQPLWPRAFCESSFLGCAVRGALALLGVGLVLLAAAL